MRVTPKKRTLPWFRWHFRRPFRIANRGNPSSSPDSREANGRLFRSSRPSRFCRPSAELRFAIVVAGGAAPASAIGRLARELRHSGRAFVRLPESRSGALEPGLRRAAAAVHVPELDSCSQLLLTEYFQPAFRPSRSRSGRCASSRTTC